MRNPTESASDSFDRTCDHLVAFLALSTKGKRAKVPISRFDGCDAFVDGVVGSRLTSEVAIFRDAVPSDLGERLNYGSIGAVDGMPGGFYLSKIRTLGIKERRGMPVGAGFELIRAMVWPDGKYDSSRIIVARDAKKWRMVWPNREPFVEENNRIADLLVGMQFSSRYYWRVLLGYEGHARIAFMTDPIGAAAAFRLRDIPEGRSRRAALRHWVSEHWRQSRNDPAEEHKVRAHLRGATEFTWNGLSCAVVPSAYDRERAAPGAL